MLFYLFIASLFWMAALLSLSSNNKNFIFIINTCTFLLFVIVAGLRYQTGYDWLVYQKYLEASPNLFSLISGNYTRPPGEIMEPLFSVLATTLVTLGGGIQTLYLITALFNGICLYYFLAWSKRNIAFCLAMYFSFCYLPLQMAAIRQSIAISFLLLAIIAFFEKKRLKFWLLFLSGFGFQYSLVFFLPFFWQAPFKKIINHLNIFMIILAIFYLSQINPISLFFSFGSLFADIPLIAQKIMIYQHGVFTNARNTLYQLYIIFNFATTFFLVRFKKTHAHKLTRLDVFLLSTLIGSLFCEAVLWAFPVLFLRIQSFQVVALFILITDYLYSLRSNIFKILLFFSTLLITMTMLLYQLTSPQWAPYIPYQSYISAIITDNAGTGLQRTLSLYSHLPH